MNDHQRATNRPKATSSSTNRARGSRPGPRGSNKPLDVRAGVIARHAQGETKTAIAKTYGIDRGTVARILSSAEIQQQVDSIRSDIAQSGDLWLARENLHRKLKKGSEVMTLATLRGFNVLRTSPEVVTNNVNVYAFRIAELKAAELAERAAGKQKNPDGTPEGKDDVPPQS